MAARSFNALSEVTISPLPVGVFMRRIITVSLPKDVQTELDRVAAEEGTSRSDIVRDSLRNFLWIRRFRSLRGKMLLKVKGGFSDQDVFNEVS